MTSFLNVLKTCYEKHTSTIVVEFISQVSIKTKIPQEELLALWNKISPEYKVTLELQDKTHGKSTLEENKTTSENTTKCSKEKSICEYISTRGDKKACTSKISDKSITKKYCAKHAKTKEKNLVNNPEDKSDSEHNKKDKEDKQDKEDNKSEQTKESPRTSPVKKNLTKNSNNKAVANEEKPLINAKLNKQHNIYVDSNTSFIIDKKSKKIYGVFKDNKINKLDKDSLDIIKANNMDYDNDLIYQLHPDIFRKHEQQNEDDNVNEYNDDQEDE